MSYNSFNPFNNQILLFNNESELELLYFSIINVLIKYVYKSIDLFFKK